MSTMRAKIADEMTVSPPVANFVSLESMSSFVKATSPAPSQPPQPTPMDMMREEINGKLERITTPKTFLGWVSLSKYFNFHITI